MEDAFQDAGANVPVYDVPPVVAGALVGGNVDLDDALDQPNAPNAPQPNAPPIPDDFYLRLNVPKDADKKLSRKHIDGWQ